MKGRLLHTVIDDLLGSIERWPELGDVVKGVVFDEANEIRVGLCDVRTEMLGETRHPDKSVSFRVGVEIRASDELVQFAHAVSNGIVPHMRLPGSGEN